MGGPGIIISRGLLIKLRQHLSYCINHLYSPHEDVEIGRCVFKYVKDVMIPVAWEVVELFMQQYDKVRSVLFLIFTILLSYKKMNFYQTSTNQLFQI